MTQRLRVRLNVVSEDQPSQRRQVVGASLHLVLDVAMTVVGYEGSAENPPEAHFTPSSDSCSGRIRC